MYATDFVYNGMQLSSFGLSIGEFEGAGGVKTFTAGSEISFNTVPMHQGRYNSLTSSKYERCLETTFDIYKDPCSHSTMEMTEEEARIIIRWLNRKNFYPFRLVYEPSIDSLYFKTEDESLNSDKQYYTRSGSGTILSPYIYKEVSSPSLASISSYYELNKLVRCYKKTSDTSINKSRCYYTASGDGTKNHPYAYDVVESPTLSHINEYYEAYGCEYEGSFNIEEITVDDILCGLRVTLITNKPFGYGDIISETFPDSNKIYFGSNNVTRSYYTKNRYVYIYNTSDEIYDMPINIEFKIKDDMFVNVNESGEYCGDLWFKFYYGSLSGKSAPDSIIMIRRGCTPGEEINIDSQNQVITTSNPNHKIYNYFDFMFPSAPRMWSQSSSYDKTIIQISSNTPGYNIAESAYFEKITFTYRPIIKGNYF